jgi:hypothetical protein
MAQMRGYRQAQDIDNLSQALNRYSAMNYNLSTELLSPVYNSAGDILCNLLINRDIDRL